MKKYNLPQGYSLLQSFLRSYKQVKDPIGAMSESMEKFNGTYLIRFGSQLLVATQELGFIDYVLKTHHRNFNKSPIVTDRLGKFLGNGLLTSNGEYWLKQRRLIQPGFHIDKIQALYAIIKRTVDNFLETFPTGEQIDVYPLMNRLAFEIVINTLFNVKVPPETRTELSGFITETQDFVTKDIRQPFLSWWFVLSGEVKKNLKHAQGSRDIIRGIIRQRKESNKKFDDLLDMLLDARYEDTGAPMNEEQVIDEILILLIAGHETTANALSWTLYLLANHPAEMAKLKNATQNLSTQECVANDQLNAVIKEVMRLYPPAWIADRIAIEDDTYGGYSFPKGTMFALFFYGLHHDGNYWPNPDSFLPDRFSTKTEKEKPKAYFPFGAGPRLCIGNNFAMAEMVIFLQAMVQLFDITPGAIAPGMKPLVTLRPDKVFLGVAKS